MSSLILNTVPLPDTPVSGNKSDSAIIDSLKLLIIELREEEEDAQQSGNHGAYSGLSMARVKLEILLESHGVRRPTTL